MFEKNESNLDRIIRAIVGAILVIVGLTALKGWAGIVALIIGLILLLTAATGFCLLYKVFGFSTLKEKEGKRSPP